MNRLIGAGLARMRKSGVFYVFVILFALLGAGLRLYAFAMEKKTGNDIPLDSIFFAAAAFEGIVMAVFCSLFVGTEYSDGTIRNKLVTGHTRGSVYLSNLILCITAGAIFSVVYWFFSILIGVPLSGFFKGDLLEILGIAGLNLLMIAADCGIAVFFSMVNQNKAVVVVISLLLSFTLFITATYITSRLQEPEYYNDFSLTVDGQIELGEDIKNPIFLEGTKRKVYEFLDDFLPGNQGMRLSGMQQPEPKPIFGLYSIIITVVMTAGGMLLFRKKNIK